MDSLALSMSNASCSLPASLATSKRRITSQEVRRGLDRSLELDNTSFDDRLMASFLSQTGTGPADEGDRAPHGLDRDLLDSDSSRASCQDGTAESNSRSCSGIVAGGKRPVPIDKRQIEVFTAAVQSAQGLDKELQDDLLRLLHGMPVQKPG
jgi:hypothetical protein